MSENSSSDSTQISLTTPTTSQSHINNTHGIPLLPLPFLDSQRTRVTFATAPSQESLNRPLNLQVHPLSKPRSSSQREVGLLKATPLPSGLDELRVETMLTKSRSSSTSDTETTGQHLQQLRGTMSPSSVAYVVGDRDYESSSGALSSEEWEELEIRGAMGTRGTLRENFEPSVQVLGQDTDNATMPFTVVNGEG